MKDKVNLNCGNGCCPDATFDKNLGSILLEEHGQSINISKESFIKLVEEAKKRKIIE